MLKSSVKTSDDALIYLTDCNLATVADMAMKKSKSKHEFQRQISIAQTAIDWVLKFGINVEKGTRVYDIISSPDQSVETWSKKI